MITILHSSPTIRKRVKMQSVKTDDMCTGGYCRLSTSKSSSKQMLSQGEGISPPLKHKENKEFYQLSYPNNEKVQAQTITPLYLKWMGRRWFSCP